VLPLRLHEEEIAFLRRKAENKGVPPSALIILALREKGWLPKRVAGLRAGTWSDQERTLGRAPRQGDGDNG